MEYEQLKKILSEPRIERYRAATGGSKAKAQKLYRVNMRVSQAFYPVLNVFEVVVRNSINSALQSHFNDPDWIITQSRTGGFMEDGSLGGRFFLKGKVREAEINLNRQSVPISANRIVAAQSFGFWKSLFQPRHYELLRGRLMQCFPNMPANTGRNAVHSRMLKINKFRNRVYHNEPICFDRYNNINFQIAESIHTSIYELLTWMDNGAGQYIGQYDNIPNKIALGRRI